jgi:hypothetical protein
MSARHESAKEAVISDLIALGYPVSGKKTISSGLIYSHRVELPTFGQKRKAKGTSRAHLSLNVDNGIRVQMFLVVNGRYTNNILDWGSGIYIADVQEAHKVFQRALSSTQAFVDGMQFTDVK